MTLVTPWMVLLACSDPAEEGAKAYVDEMKPIMVEHHGLSTAQLETARQVMAGELGAHEVRARYEASFTPTSGALRDLTKSVEVPAEPVDLAETHQVLVDAWTKRAEAYLAIQKAYSADDLEAFDAAQRQNLETKVLEDQYFQQVNTILAPFELELAPVP